MSLRLMRQRLSMIGAVVLVLGVFGAACGDTTTTTTTTTSSSGPESTAPASSEQPTATDVATTIVTTDVATTTPEPTTSVLDITTTTARKAETTLTNVYWGWEVLNPPAGSPERIGAGTREVEADVPIRNSLDAMFGGLNTAEQIIGMTTSVPAGTSVLGVAVDGATVTVDLSSEFASSSGSLDETIRLAQVVFTVTQFDGIERVKFHIDGTPQDPILSHGFVVGDGLTRDDFAGVRASIMIEEPYPGAEVTDPLVIRGESNTFEATVRYAITSGDGDILTEGFTTATNGNGVWGTFEVDVDGSDFEAGDKPERGSIVMWEDSPRDGSQLNVVEIPIVFTS